MKGLFTPEGRKKAAEVVVYGARPYYPGIIENGQQVATAFLPEAIERRIEELLRRISEKVKPIGGN